MNLGDSPQTRASVAAPATNSTSTILASRRSSEGRLLVMSPIRRVPCGGRSSIYTPAYRRERRRRILGWLLVVIGSVMALVHFFTHLGRLHIVGYQDLLLGYPMAAVLVLAGFVLVGMATKPSR
jgi:hypothetical protein